MAFLPVAGTQCLSGVTALGLASGLLPPASPLPSPPSLRPAPDTHSGTGLRGRAPPATRSGPVFPGEAVCPGGAAARPQPRVVCMEAGALPGPVLLVLGRRALGCCVGRPFLGALGVDQGRHRPVPLSPGLLQLAWQCTVTAGTVNGALSMWPAPQSPAALLGRSWARPDPRLEACLSCHCRLQAHPLQVFTEPDFPEQSVEEACPLPSRGQRMKSPF